MPDADCPEEKQDHGALRTKPGVPTRDMGGSNPAGRPESRTRCSRPRQTERGSASGRKRTRTHIREGPTNHQQEASHQPASETGDRHEQASTAKRAHAHTRKLPPRRRQKNANEDHSDATSHPPDWQKSRIRRRQTLGGQCHVSPEDSSVSLGEAEPFAHATRELWFHVGPESPPLLL